MNLFAVRKNLPDYVNNFKVRMLSPSTVEDADRDEQLNNRVGMLRDMMDVISSNESVVDDNTSAEIITYMFSTFLNKPEIAQMIQDYQNSKPEVDESLPETESDDSSDVDLDVNLSHSSGGGSFDSTPDLFNDMDSLEAGGLDIGESEATTPDESGITAPDEFGDYEDFA